MDLVRRKVAGDGGKAAAALIDEVRATAAELGQCADGAIAALQGPLDGAAEALETASRWMAESLWRQATRDRGWRGSLS